MGYYVADVNGYVGDLASNMGLSQMYDWLEKQDCPKIHQLMKNGFTEDMKGALKDLNKLPPSGDPDIDITIDGLKKLLPESIRNSYNQRRRGVRSI